MLKRIFAVFLMMAIVCVAFSGWSEEELDDLQPLTIEYGDAERIYNDDDTTNCFLLYPVLGIEKVDAELERWAIEFFESVNERFMDKKVENPAFEGELNVQFNDYLVELNGARYVLIEEFGYVNDNESAHGALPIKTFNVSLDQERLLDKYEIISWDEMPALAAALKQKLLAEYPDDIDASMLDSIDETWFDNIMLMRGGLDVLLEQSVYLPTYLGMVRVSFTYEELGGAFLMNEPSIPVDSNGALTGTVAAQAGASSTKPKLALTFDDGPSAYTTKILNLLSKYNAKATFFQLGNRVAKYAEVERAIVAQGSEIASHTWDHKQLTKLSEARIRQELASTSAALASAGVPTVKLMRPPYGSYNAAVVKVAKEMGYAIIRWSVDTVDWKTLNADAVFSQIKKDAKSGAIILCHDIHKSTAAAMERAIPWLAERYQLVTVTELLASNGGTLEAGKVYFKK